MRFWDASALVPLFIAETNTAKVERLLTSDEQIAAWWGSLVECVSAVARVERSGRGTADEVTGTLQRLHLLHDGWLEVSPSEEIRAEAQRLLRLHTLRAADALQLAAAKALAAHAFPFVSFDVRLRTAAQREGLRVVPV